MTKHKDGCKMSFGRKDETCPRCQELLNGAEPRSGWQKDYFANKKMQELLSLAQPEHDCEKSNCMAVCTFGDW